MNAQFDAVRFVVAIPLYNLGDIEHFADHWCIS